LFLVVVYVDLPSSVQTKRIISLCSPFFATYFLASLP
jgi:hypothetical protein